MSERNGNKNGFLKIGALFFLAGIVLFVIGFSMLGLDFVKLDGTKYSEVDKSVDVTGLTGLEVDFGYSDLIVVPSEDSTNLTVKGFIASDSTLDITTENNKLKVKLETNYKWWIPVIFNSGSKRTLTVSVPKGVFEWFDLLVDSGDITVGSGDDIVGGFENLSNLKTVAYSGRINITDIKAKTIDADSKSGSLFLGQIVSETIKADCLSGKITMTDVTASKQMNVSLSSGSTTLTNISVGEAAGKTGVLTVKNLSGAIRINNSIIHGTMTINNSSGSTTLNEVKTESLSITSQSGTVTLTNIKCVTAKGKNSSGDFRLTRLDAEEIDLYCASGGIKGSIVGQLSDYRISTQVSSGSSNLNSTTSGDRSMILKVSSGTIRIDFVQ